MPRLLDENELGMSAGSKEGWCGWSPVGKGHRGGDEVRVGAEVGIDPHLQKWEFSWKEKTYNPHAQ